MTSGFCWLRGRIGDEGLWQLLDWEILDFIMDMESESTYEYRFTSNRRRRLCVMVSIMMSKMTVAKTRSPPTTGR